MSDPQDRPRDGDRKRAVEEIDSAYAEGRITAADRALRVSNVESAATISELDLVVRDLILDPGEVAPRMVPPPPAQPAPPPPPPAPPPPPSSAASPTLSVSVGSSLPPPPDPGRGFRVTSGQSAAGKGFRIGCLLVVAVIVLISVGASLFIARLDFGDLGDSADPSDPFTFEDPIDPLEPFDPGDPATLPPTAGPVDKLAFTEAGLRWFIARYEDEFGTTRTFRLTLWKDRASVERPVHGGRRQDRWSYRDGEFEKFGPVTTKSPGTSVSDLRDLRLKALVANIARAKRTLNVENPETVYVILGDDSLGDGAQARIYVTNKYNESGYMATTYGGTVVRTYAFQR